MDWRRDLIVTSQVAQDTLDYTGPRVNEGSKAILLALGDPVRELPGEFEGEVPPGTRDVRVFEAQHVAFGIGNHFCLGANLARMEMRVAFAEILRRFPDMQYRDAGPVFGTSALVRSVQHMYVRYSGK